METEKIPSVDKKTFLLRLSPILYRKIRYRVQKEKDKGNFKCSINELLTEFIEKGLKEKNK